MASQLPNSNSVVVVGAGFAGLETARELGRAGVSVTLIDRQNYHLFQPLLYQVATAALSPADIAEPIRKIVRAYQSVNVLLGNVIDVDLRRRCVILEGHNAVPYDILVLATGATHSYFGRDHWSEIAPALKTLDDARAIRSRVLRCFEQAEMTPDIREQRRLLTIAVVGGGPTGVELAGSVAELARYSLAKDFRRIDANSARILLVEAGPRILASFPTALSAYAHDRLRALGVEVLTARAVRDITPESMTIDGETFPVGAVVWAAGVKPAPAATWIQARTDRAGRILVDFDLRAQGHESVYVLGDLAAAHDDAGDPLPGLAQVAKQQGHHVGKSLARQLKAGVPVPPFRFRNRGSAAIIGRHAAVFDFGRLQLTGALAWFSWALVHVYLLVGFQHRVLVSIQWLWRYLTYERGARLITEELSPVNSPKSPAPLSAVQPAHFTERFLHGPPTS